MPKLRLTISMSLDGYVAGPDQSAQEPLGKGGEALHEWLFPLKAWRAPHGLEGGETNPSNAIVEEWTDGIGATLMGRNMFGGHPGPWKADKPWTGWWGRNPPFRHPVFVLTHHAREPLVLEGGTTFFFVTGGIREAYDQARRAAGTKDITLAGGAKAAQQFLAAGLVDQMEIHLAPILLGGGERLFEGVGADLHGLKRDRVVVGPIATHIRYSR